MLTAEQLLSSTGSHSRTARSQQQSTCNVIQLVALNAAPDPPANTAPPQVSGAALEGEVLTATAGSWSGSPTSFAYSWERCDSGGGSCAAVPGATATTYALTAADVGSRLRVVVTASNSGGSTSAASAPTTVVVPIAPPANTALPTISGTAREGQSLTATTGSWSSSPTGYAFQWERCEGTSCTPIPDATGPNHLLGAPDTGYGIRVLVTASNAAGSTTASSATTAVVLPQPPSNSTLPTVSGTPRLGETLTASLGSWSGSPTSFDFQWERCDADGDACSTIVGATSQEYDVSANDLGSRARVVVTASNAGGSGSAASEPTSIVLPDPPESLDPPTISGIPRESEVLTAYPGTWSSSPTGYAYQWQSSGDGGFTWTDISGSSATYVPVSADVGAVLRVVVSATNAGGSSATASAATTTIAPVAVPAIVIPPEVTGTAQEGTELHAATGVWTGTPSSYGFQWQRCEQDGVTCTAIDSATAATYTPTAMDIGWRVRVVVSATNAAGTSTAESSGTNTVLRAAPANTSAPVVSGSTIEGEDLIATAGDWSGDPTEYTYLWYRCDVATSESCTAVTWADSPEYRLRAADVGVTIRVFVTASNEGGPASAFSAPTAVVIPLPPISEALPVVSGVLEEGESVSATPGSWHSSGPLQYGFQWQASSDGGGSWSDLEGADESTYRLGAAEVGSVVRVVVTATNAGGAGSAASDATAAISSPGRPVNTEPPTYSGFVQTGRTVTADPGTWSGTPTSFEYQWQRSSDDGQTWVDATGATESTFALQGGDVGLELRVSVTATNVFGQGTAASPWTRVYPAARIAAAANQQWRCSATVDLDLVKVTLWTRDIDAVVFGNNCTGRIGRVEVDTWTQDALKTVNSSTNAAHDLVVESGFAVCHDRTPGAHQDGWQSMGGMRITVRNFVWACGDLDDPFSGGVAQSVVIARAGAGVTIPTDTVVEHSVLLPGAAHSFALGESVRSGARASVICPDRTGLTPFVDLGGAIDPIYETIEEPLVSDPRCSSLAAAIAWAQGGP
jgi:hypothetical protein